ncbi:AI-2E family transporter [Microcoleus sp. FACHB-1515]|uniref:AI-2E family transporter n=1 Tax=Cyanophyceae TaxID=3028117 RepID=UPI00168219FB|nr:AI-2E family transporter [Microcoleus sp. FACHB-1515]MBD2088984.1 AI-2E family transporter [Microcoleus sp. FACHB-1515]
MTPPDSLNRILRWLLLALLFPLICLNGWLSFKVVQFFQPLVTSLMLAALLAFLLNTPVYFLQKQGLQRPWAAAIVAAIAGVTLGSLGLTLVPALSDDVREVVQLVPQWLDSASQQLASVENLAQHNRLPAGLSQVVAGLSDRLPQEIESFADEALALGLGAIGNISEALLTAVLTFYLLLDGDKIANGFFDRLPGKTGETVRQALQKNFQNYFLGQLALSALVGTLITITFLLLKVPYAMLFGLTVGVVSIIPFGDSVTFTLISLLLAAQNPWLGARVFVISLVIDQLIDQLITPRLLGRFTGLRPLWVLIALIVGTKIGGLLGLILAVPLSGFAKSLLDEWRIIPEGSETAEPDLTEEVASAELAQWRSP